MRISAWATVAAVGLAGSILAPGCVVGSDDDNNNTDGGSGAGGSSGSSGSSGTGGSSGSGGTSGRGGTSGTGGSAGTGGTGGSGASCAPDAMDNNCVECMKTNCCTELLACAADDLCSGTAGEGELTCVQDCVLAQVADGGVVDNSTVTSCATGCAEMGSAVSVATSDAVGCMRFGGELSDGGNGVDCLVDCLAGD